MTPFGEGCSRLGLASAVGGIWDGSDSGRSRVDADTQSVLLVVKVETKHKDKYRSKGTFAR